MLASYRARMPVRAKQTSGRVGEVAEWFKAGAGNGCYALKRIGGSNPSPLRQTQELSPAR
jgi:hypothetical protein